VSVLATADASGYSLFERLRDGSSKNVVLLSEAKKGSSESSENLRFS
jgi:hypothetical protein